MEFSPVNRNMISSTTSGIRALSPQERNDVPFSKDSISIGKNDAPALIPSKLSSSPQQQGKAAGRDAAVDKKPEAQAAPAADMKIQPNNSDIPDEMELSEDEYKAFLQSRFEQTNESSDKYQGLMLKDHDSGFFDKGKESLK